MLWFSTDDMALTTTQCLCGTFVGGGAGLGPRWSYSTKGYPKRDLFLNHPDCLPSIYGRLRNIYPNISWQDVSVIAFHWYLKLHGTKPGFDWLHVEWVHPIEIEEAVRLAVRYGREHTVYHVGWNDHGIASFYLGKYGYENVAIHEAARWILRLVWRWDFAPMFEDTRDGAGSR